MNPHHEIPIDSVARKVVFSNPIHYNHDIKSNTHGHTELCPPMEDLANAPYKLRNDPNFKDLSGKKYGRFKCLGLLKNTFNKWVLRCVCGNYEIRRTTTLNQMEKKEHSNRCQKCMDTLRLQYRDYKKTHGVYPWGER